jgi:uroporphyrin-3 C-methyltransferase
MKDKIVSDQKNKSKAVSSSPSNSLSTDSKPTDKKSANRASENAAEIKPKADKNIVAITSLILVIAATGFFQYRVEMLGIKNSALEKHLTLITEQNTNQVRKSGQLTEQLTQSKTQLDAMSGQLAFMRQTLNQIPGARLEDWKLAEVEYLLRLANQRVTLQKEVTGVSALLDAADAILAALDDPAMLLVREKISQEMLLLGQASDIDQQGVYTKLQALKNIIHDTIQPPSTFTQSLLDESSLPSDAAESKDKKVSIIDQLLSLVSVRTRDQAFDAPLATEQYQLLEHSLTLMLEQAQWAVLKGDQKLYQASLGNAQNWIKNTLRHQQANIMLGQITLLASQTISATLPDVSQSLRLLRQVMENRTYAPSSKTLDSKPVDTNNSQENTKQEQAT